MDSWILMSIIMIAPIVLIVVFIMLIVVVHPIKDYDKTLMYRILEKQIEEIGDGEKKYYFLIKRCEKSAKIKKVEVPYDVFIKYEEQDIY